MIDEFGYVPNEAARYSSLVRFFAVGYSWTPQPQNAAAPILEKIHQGMLSAVLGSGYPVKLSKYTSQQSFQPVFPGTKYPLGEFSKYQIFRILHLLMAKLEGVMRGWNTDLYPIEWGLAGVSKRGRRSFRRYILKGSDRSGLPSVRNRFDLNQKF